MDDRFNTIAGWVLGAGIVLLGATLVSHEMFKEERPEPMGYPIAGVVQEGHGAAAAEQPIAHFLQTADAGRGAAAFRKCTACHNADQGGANGTGPNLWGSMGGPIARRAGYSYSAPLSAHGGNWDWESMSAWLRSPRTFAAGTKMTFAGLSDPQERADLLLFLNQHGGTLTLPPPPAAAPAEGNAAEGNEAAGNEAAPAANAAAPAPH
ncbi:MAG TPA: cytochrome c family protein [Allosphingosinicella sp.]|nr:cytochrome c family protein [Allosphingosinicella sp.]